MAMSTLTSNQKEGNMKCQNKHNELGFGLTGVVEMSEQGISTSRSEMRQYV